MISSYIVWFILPRGMGQHGSQFCPSQIGQGLAGNYVTVLGWPRYVWIEIHSWASVALLVVILLHIILHWGWIVATTKRVKSYIGKRVRRVTELYVAAVVLFILFLFESFSGFVIWLFIPRGAADFYRMISGVGRTFWGLQRNIWVDLHAWVAVAIMGIIIVHIIMNWNWVVAMSKKILQGISGAISKPSEG
ncbi:MAG TPA: DUF4405 domain-containing protein [Dehalococcoidia bacterium]|nr:DUF4405 domain-containing protein [Dehalococcoidia bacterium]